MSKSIVIVGGGAAGWIAAGLLKKKFEKDRHAPQITLIESPEIETVGVGEGTWPSMRATLQRIGISEFDLFRECNAVPKQGSVFVGWKKANSEAYVHPFMAPEPLTGEVAYAYWALEAHKNKSYAEEVSTQAGICLSSEGICPKMSDTPEYKGFFNYGYHLDAAGFIRVLARHCRLSGVTHKSATIEHVISSKDNGVEELLLSSGEKISADLYIDCTGFKSLIRSKTSSIKWKSASQYLFNDRAIAFKQQYSPEMSIKSATFATAHKSGWIWDISLQSRRGIGCVYSSDHMTESEAVESLASYAGENHKKIEADAKIINFSAKYIENPWDKNVIALGMSSGFVEPLEASALVMIEKTVSDICLSLTSRLVIDATTRNKFNQRFESRWLSIVEFIKLHYVTSNREEEYWRRHSLPETCPDSLLNKLESWKHRMPNQFDLDLDSNLFSSESYRYVLFGMKTIEYGSLSEDFLSEIKQKFQSHAEGMNNLLDALPTNRQYFSSLN